MTEFPRERFVAALLSTVTRGSGRRDLTNAYAHLMAEAEARGRARFGDDIGAAGLVPLMRDQARQMALDAEFRMAQRGKQHAERLREQGVRPTKARVADALIRFAEAFADTVSRTVSLRAQTVGAFRALERRDLREDIPAMRFVTMQDDRVRDNHRAAEGFVAMALDPVWRDLSPPLGFNCRCSLQPVTAREARTLGLRANLRAPAGAHRDRGFRA